MEVPESEDFVEEKPISAELEGWKPKTSVGKQVQSGEITDIDVILDSGKRILEPQIADALLPGLQKELLLVGQSKGKFGGGSRRIFKQTQKKTPEGNNPSFACFAVVGNEDGYVGGGFGKSKDTVPAREKATRNAKLNVFKIRRGCGSWECGCKTPHSIPFEVSGKCGSVCIRLIPAPKGKGLCIEPECAKILKLAGIRDVWSKTFGQTKVKTNLVKACMDALKQLMKVKVNPNKYAALGIAEGRATTRMQEEEKNE
ncbi:30S ribosomal protein S5 [Candidatus Woesearchaeota archaeon]|nr:30S ribosomal protein S5 [Candidatus Woesearchaeota archaeon]MBW3006054.1 30S ribosomal protein S5 [Candidatus Woesearchaeota archaeon]